MPENRRSFAPKRLQDYLDNYGAINIATDPEFLTRLVETFDVVRTIEVEVSGDGYVGVAPESLLFAAALRMIGEIGAPPGISRLWGILYCNGDDHGEDPPWAHVTFQVAHPKYVAALVWVLREIVPE